jgi:hypothetical protein
VSLRWPEWNARAIPESDRHRRLLRDHGQLRVQRARSDLQTNHRTALLPRELHLFKVLRSDSNIQEQVEPYNYHALDGMFTIDLTHD